MSRIAVIDHGAGNLVSIAQGLTRAGADVAIVGSPAGLDDADGIVLPGVGTTGAAMRRLHEAGLVSPLQSWARPLLGICVGLQLFFEHSEEDGTDALGLMPGRVSTLEDPPLLPHIGWNDVSFQPDPLFANVPSDATFYFVHSYAVVPEDQGVVIAETSYGQRFVAAARSGNRVGVQFHPERSGSAGLQMLANFVAETQRARNAA
ncbi:MAG: imidazole glycerol phosphate synthase subunit HisH [bacterium]|nr:imidazole glycerol phosphate synthase subunit HisH [bacterium]MCP4968842.1 imidazole glycerol phosphate synthase subunit HisH [bacterium]